MAKTAPSYFLGVDAGGTKTRARLVTSCGNIISHGLSGPANTQLGTDASFSAIFDAIMQTIHKAGHAIPAPELAICIGLAGFSRRNISHEILSRLNALGSIRMTTDAIVANFGAHSGRDGAIISVGTGSVVVGKLGDTVFQFGGYGVPLSDEGGGAQMGMQACRETLRAIDGRRPHCALTEELAPAFGKTPRQIVQAIDKLKTAEFASMAPTIFRHAEHGDETAIAIVKLAADEVAQLIRITCVGNRMICCLTGGLSTSIRNWLASDTIKYLSEPAGDGVDGALHLAKTPLAIKAEYYLEN